MLYEKGRYKETCGPCGAVFEVVVFGKPMAKLAGEPFESYLCPECGQSFQCRAATPPRVTLLSGRVRAA